MALLFDYCPVASLVYMWHGFLCDYIYPFNFNRFDVA